MTDDQPSWKHQRVGFRRAHHEAWKFSELNQREYCEVRRLPQKGFENWRQKFKAEPQVPAAQAALSTRRPKSRA